MFKNMKIGMKQICGFLLVTVIVAVAGVTGINGLNSVGVRLTEITHTSPLVDATMEMKINVARDLQMIMEILEAENQEKLDQVWQEHESFVEGFFTYSDAILHGARTEEGMIYAAKDDGLKKIVIEAGRFHNEEFQTRIKKIYDLMIEEYTVRQQLTEVMASFEGEFARIVWLAEDFEGQVKERIKTRMAEGATAEQILKT